MYVLLYFLLITLFVLLIYKISLDKTKPIQTKLGESVNKNVSNSSIFLNLTKNWKSNFSNMTYNGITIDSYNDKYNANKLVESFNIRVPKIYFVGKYNDLPTGLLDDYANYVIKPRSGHSSKNVFLVSNGIDSFTSKAVTQETLHNSFGLWNDEIIVEELLKDGNSTILDDYKCYVFDGDVKFILHKSYKNGKYTRNWYNRKWESIKPLKTVDNPGVIQKKPPFFNKMINDIETIGKNVFKKCFLRIDFYITHQGPVFGEITPNPANGYGYTDYGLKILDRLCIEYGLA
uniref:ATP-grasp domain-containing protein n=1 Tax=viral metagenome TaxID=1070528 RepID=A0A6C0AVH0_9ZZZZ